MIILTQYLQIFFMGICASQFPKRGIIGGISGYGTGPPLFSFFKKPQKVLAWGGTEVCQAGFDGLTARRIDWIDGLTAWKTGFLV